MFGEIFRCKLQWADRIEERGYGLKQGNAFSEWARGIALVANARKYAKRLGPRLQRAYGASERYTPRQIAKAAQACGLSTRYLRIGYAAFLDEGSYRAAVGDEFIGDYDFLRTLFFKCVKFEIKSIGANAVENRSVMEGGG